MRPLRVYSASKAYVDVFSRALAQEYGPKGITVQSLMPQFVVSKLSKMRKASLQFNYTRNVRRSGPHNVGVEGQTTGYWPQQLQWFVAALFPDTWVSGLNRVCYCLHPLMCRGYQLIFGDHKYLSDSIWPMNVGEKLLWSMHESILVRAYKKKARLAAEGKAN